MSHGFTLQSSYHSLPHQDGKPSFRDRLAAFWKTIEKAQIKKAEFETVRILQTMDDKTLAHFGYSQKDIALIKRGQFVRLPI